MFGFLSRKKLKVSIGTLPEKGFTHCETVEELDKLLKKNRVSFLQIGSDAPVLDILRQVEYYVFTLDNFCPPRFDIDSNLETAKQVVSIVRHINKIYMRKIKTGD